MEIISMILSVAMYVMQGVALQTIARRRGIRHDWLAWVPVGSVWILGAIADDYRQRIRGGRSRLRVWMLILMAAVVLLMILAFVYMANNVLPVLTKAVSEEELLAYYDAVYYGEQDLYSEAPEELMEKMVTQMEQKLTEQDAEALLTAMLVFLLLVLVAGAVGLALTVLEYICQYRLYASCDPAYKVLFLILGIWLGTAPICMFLCRHKDLGMPPAMPGLPGGPDPENYRQEPPMQDPPAYPM